MAPVKLRNVTKSFGDVEVVHGIDLSIEDKEFVVLVGPSGCGKSTILRMIAGLEEISGGQIEIGDRVVNELEPKDRNIAMVFQDYALYPHLSVSRNMSFGLENQKLSRSEITERVQNASAILGLEELMDRKPKQLSGGQRQRVAMGRAIVRNPKVFLFDEPLSNLDAKLRGQMRTEIKKLHHRVETTIVFVTHDQVEAMTLADRVVVLKDGYIEQIGTPDDVYNSPASLFVAGFIGSPAMNFLNCTVTPNGTAVSLSDGAQIAVPKAQQSLLKNVEHVIMGVRPENFSLVQESQGKAPSGSLKVTIDVDEPLGSDRLIFFQLGEKEMVARVPPRPKIVGGDTVLLSIDMQQSQFFNVETGRRLDGNRQ